MTNKFGIPADVERAIRTRDKVCVYCRRRMKEYRGRIGNPGDKATIEHLHRHKPFYVDEGLKLTEVAICCQSCNSSRGRKRLRDWFESAYCVERKINPGMVKAPVKKYLKTRRSVL